MRSSKLKIKLSSLSARVSQLEYDIQDIKKILKNKGENIYNSIQVVPPSRKKSRKKARGSNSNSTSSSNSGLSSFKRRRDSSVMPSSLSSLSTSRSSTYMSPVIKHPSYVYQEVPGSAKNYQYGTRPKPSRRRSSGNNKKNKSVSRTIRTKSV
jgi:hypothetical protein